MKTKHIACLGALVIFSLLLSALTGTVQAAEKNEITIGYAVPLTGTSGMQGRDTQRGYQLWLDKIEKAGGLLVGNKRFPVKFIPYDDESDASTCVKRYEKLITGDKVDFVFSPWGSGNNFAASAVAEKYKYPIVLSSASTTNIFERGFKYIFQTTPLSYMMVQPWISFLKAYHKEIKTAAIIYENFLFTVFLNDSLSKYVQEAGVKLLLDEKYPLGCKDFAGILLKVKGLNPDALFVLNIMPASIYATRQAYEIGVTPKLFMVNMGPIFKEEFIGGIGELSEKLLETGFWHPDLPFPGTKEFVRDCQAKFGKYPGTDVAWAYIACQIFEKGVEKAGTVDREKVAQILHKEKFETIGGPYEYDEHGVNKFPCVFLVQVQKKERVIVWPKDLATAKLEFMR